MVWNFDCALVLSNSHFYSDLNLGEHPCAFQHTAQPQSHCEEHTNALDPVLLLILSQLYFQLAFFPLFFRQYEIWGVQLIEHLTDIQYKTQPLPQQRIVRQYNPPVDYGFSHTLSIFSYNVQQGTSISYKLVRTIESLSQDERQDEPLCQKMREENTFQDHTK